jgi:protein TonB
MMIDVGNPEDAVSGGPKAPASRGSVRIVDLIFAGQPRGGRRRLALGGLAVVVLYAVGFALVGRLGPSAHPGRAGLPARVHETVAVEREVELTPPPPPPPARAPSAVPAVAAVHVARAMHAAPARPAAPAQAGKLAALSPEPIDFTGSAFVVGSGSSYAGGATTSTGTNHAAALGAVASGATGEGSAPAPKRARAVSLDQAAWNCPWPAEADAQQVNEQTVVLRATVGPDGRVDHVDLLSDPGFGFGAAARLCALRTRFDPARDAGGQPVVALSPPIRVHFFR